MAPHRTLALLRRILPAPAKRYIRGVVKLAPFTVRERIAVLDQRSLRMAPQPRLSYIVLKILDHCNLRCKGCDHFAAIARRHFVSLESIQGDLGRMADLFDRDVARIGVMGGEPLLHPELKQILAETRRHFPNTVIQLVTNGILLMRQDEEFWSVCRENGIVIVNTRYPIGLDHGAMAATARANQVMFEHFGETGANPKTSYRIPLDVSGEQDGAESFLDCFHANHLVLIMEGRLYGCTVAPNVHIFNERFGTALELEEGDHLDIHKAQSKKEVLEFLCRPKPFCRYCDVGHRSYGHPWQRSKGEMSEWTA